MIAVPLFVALLAATPGLSGVAAASAAAAVPTDEKVTLSLKDADLTKLLENFATLLGMTPIIAHDVRGTVTMDAHASIAELLHNLERDFQLTIRVADGRMIVSKAAGPPPDLDGDAADLRYLADTSFPRRATAMAPKRFGGSVEFRTTAGASRIYSLARSGGLSIPGCPSGVAMFPLDEDGIDGFPALAVRAEGILPRILSPSLDETALLEIPGCSGPVSVRLQPSNPGDLSAAPLPNFGEFVIQPYFIAVTIKGEEAEEALSAPRIQTLGGETAAVTSTSDRDTGSSLLLHETIQTAVVIVDASEKDATVAISSAILRDVDPKDGSAPVTIRIARARESARLAFGKTHRIVLSPTFGRGDSALVLDVIVERAPARR